MIKAPYNFVPLNKYVYIPEWNNKISQDIPFEHSEDGTICLKLENVTPLYIRNGSSQKECINESFSAHIVDNYGRKIYYIPATSIKGMIRSVMEVLTFSKMLLYDDDFFGYRDFDTKVPTGKKYQSVMQNIRCGWLYKKDDDFVLEPCRGDFETVDMANIIGRFPKIKADGNALEIRNSLKENYGDMYPMYKGRTLICTGFFNKKKNEYLFPERSGEKLVLSKDVSDAFISVYKPSKLYYKYLIDSLKVGEKIPVFFRSKNDNEVESLGLTRMYRYPYLHRVKDGIKQEFRDLNGKVSEGMDMVQCIFGYTDKKNSLKGRLQFGNAFSKKPIDDALLIELKGVLGSPLASYCPLYLKQNGNSYSTYDSQIIEIAGRKRYRIHSNDYITHMPEGDENKNKKVLTTLKLIPQGNEFELEIHTHNMLSVEIGALISALTFHLNDTAYHNLGMAKSYGYGKMIVKNISLCGFKYDRDYYLNSFEKIMSYFTYSSHMGLWIDTEEVRTLMYIASDHHKDLELMSFDDYKAGKKYTNYSKLNERQYSLCHYITQGDMKRMSFQKEFNKVDHYIEMKKYAEALDFLFLIEDKLGEDVEVNSYISKIHKLQEEEVLKEKLEKEEKEKKQKLIKNASGLSILDEVYELGPNQGQPKVKDFQGVRNRVEKWMKDSDNAVLPEDQIDILSKSLQRVYTGIKKERDKKEWQKWHEGVWKSIEKWIGNDDITKDVYNRIINNS